MIANPPERLAGAYPAIRIPISFHSEQHKVVCNQHLHAECGGSATISLEVTTEIHQI